MLLRKMWRDIKGTKVQFLSIFIMVFLGAFIYAGIGGEWFGVQVVLDDFVEKTNAADIWLYGNNWTDEAVNLLEETDGVTAAERRLTLSGVSSHNTEAELMVSFVTENRISRAFSMVGSDFDSADCEGVWVDKTFAEANQLTVGDTLDFSVMQMPFSMEIRGLILDSDHIYTPNTNGDSFYIDPAKTGYLFMSYATLPTEVQGMYSQVLLSTSTTDYDAMIRRFDENEQLHFSAVVTRDAHPSYSTIRNEIQQHKAMATAFPIAFLLVAMLTVVTTMTRLVANQRTIIATLKALGFPKRKLYRHYLSYILVLSAVGAVLGSVVGPLSLPWLFYPSMSKAYILPSWQPAISWNFMILPILLVGLSVFTTFLVLRGYLREKPAQGMRPRKGKKARRSILSRWALFRNMHFSTRWNIRDISLNKVRSLMVVVGIVGCSGLLFCAFSTQDSMGFLMDWQFEVTAKYETELHLAEGLDLVAAEKLAADTDSEILMSDAVEIRAGDARKSGQMTVVKSDSVLLKFLEQNRSEVSLREDGLLLTRRMAALLDVSVGDTVEWHIYGEEVWTSCKVTGLYYSPSVQGIAMTRGYLESTGRVFAPTRLLTLQTPDSLPMGASAMISRDVSRSSMDEMLEMMNLMVFLLILAAVVLAVVVLYCLGIISFSEKYRDLATLKVLGFKNALLRKLLFFQNFFLSVAALPLGFLFGYALIKLLMADMAEGFDMAVVFTPLTLLISIAGTLLVSSLVSLLFSRRVKSIDMVAALKGTE